MGGSESIDMMDCTNTEQQDCADPSRSCRLHATTAVTFCFGVEAKRVAVVMELEGGSVIAETNNI
jgi:hypothetical protein